MHAVFLGASKNIGYLAALRHLKQGGTATFLLRNPSVFDNDEEIQSYVKSGKAQLVRGDALNPDDVRNVWESAVQFGQGTVDFVLFSIGGLPNFSFSKGLYMNPPDLCTRSLRNALSALPAALRQPGAQPRWIVVTSMGLTRASHSALPLMLKPFYGAVLASPHADKLGMERVLAECTGKPWTEDEVSAEVLPAGWAEAAGLPAPGELTRLVIVRPALLTDGRCRGDEVAEKMLKKPGKDRVPYRTLANEEFGDGYTISRADIAHFVINGILPDWSRWEGKVATVAY